MFKGYRVKDSAAHRLNKATIKPDVSRIIIKSDMDLSNEVSLLVNSNQLDDALAMVNGNISKVASTDNHTIDRLIEG